MSIPNITLETLARASEQDVFDQVAIHLINQGKQSQRRIKDTDVLPICVYRTGSLACAAGCLIGEGEYHTDMEGSGWDLLKKEGKVPKAHANLIADLQGIHDDIRPVEWWDALVEMADEMRLSFDNIKQETR